MRFRVSPLLVFAAIFSISGCGDKIEPGTTKKSPPGTHRVAVSTAQPVDRPLIYEAVATVQAGFTSNLASKITAMVKEIRVREGARVKMGDKLVILDKAQEIAGLNQSEAALSEAKKALGAAISGREAALTSKELAYATYQRYQNLKKAGSVGVQEYDEVEARHRQADAALMQAEALVEAASARVQQAEAAVSSARVTLSDLVISAPYDGIISARLVDEGVLATPGMPLLTIEATGGYRVDMVLSEAYIEYARRQQKVSVQIPALKAEPLEGTISTIVPSADERSRSFLIKVSLPPDQKVKSGMFARVQIPLGRSTHLLVNLKAVVTRGQLTGLYLVDSDNVAHYRLIRTGKAFGDAIEVLSGLKDGDRYVEDPPLTLADGARVEVAP